MTQCHLITLCLHLRQRWEPKFCFVLFFSARRKFTSEPSRYR